MKSVKTVLIFYALLVLLTFSVITPAADESLGEKIITTAWNDPQNQHTLTLTDDEVTQYEIGIDLSMVNNSDRLGPVTYTLSTETNYINLSSQGFDGPAPCSRHPLSLNGDTLIIGKVEWCDPASIHY